MFIGLSGLLADLVMFVGPLLIVLAEGPGAYRAVHRWLVRRRLDPILHPELRTADPAPVREISTAGLLDPCPTERLRLEAVRAALAAGKPPRPREGVEEVVLVGAGAPVTAPARVRPSIREHRT